MDVIALARIGIPVGVATCGTALTPDHIKTLKRYTQHIQLLFDTDNAGYQAALRGLKLCYEQEIRPEMLSLPDGIKDIDERANANPSTEEIETFT
jgi:DNA primase